MGPTILDVNSGFLRDHASGVVNIYRDAVDKKTGELIAPAVVFSTSDLALYRSVFDRIRARIVSVFNLTHLYFTAPTFVTRIIGHPDWQPIEPHDEYFHPHVDMANTPHYHYSGLLYLSTFGGGGDDATDTNGDAQGDTSSSLRTARGSAQDLYLDATSGGVRGDFTGGAFAFLQHRDGAVQDAPAGSSADPEAGTDASHVVHPRAGRLVAFSSGHENLHAVRRVHTGTRYVFSMWFTCDPEKEFGTFLDNKSHGRASGARGAAAATQVGGKGKGGEANSKRKRPARASRKAADSAGSSGNRIVPSGGDGEL